MKANLLLPTGRYDRAAVMKDAHRQMRLMRGDGWTWSRCPAFSWSKAKGQRAMLAQRVPMADAPNFCARRSRMTSQSVTLAIHAPGFRARGNPTAAQSVALAIHA